MYDDNIESCIESIENFMQAFGIEESNLGMVVSPRYDEEKGSMKLDYFLKSSESRYKPALDSSVYTDVSTLEFNNKVYGEWLEAIETNFSEARIAAADPEKLSVRPPSPQ
ncbi:hypothetical protein AQV86_00225 [Nanohaloarchaea archaeon SG9]|nr:hypothetical protein AQV86_00225 [Nanohaloarchaea archaeon SG9]